MGLLLKIALFAVAVYAAWKTFHRWKGLFDRFVGNTPVETKREPPQAPTVPPAPPPAAGRPRVIEEAVPCKVCGAYLSSGAAKCGRTDCPLP
ncbi:MAG: hypothetical protein K2Y40_19075 [Reyranella sp.]|nr:hypothetical protein [Reyranella sp.]